METNKKNNFIRDFIYGVILGIANIIPAVSGGTMAVILNIYDKILYAISLKNIKSNLSFLLPLFLGCGAGIIAFSHIMAALLEDYSMILNFCFLGLILGSIPMIYKRARYERVKPRNLIFFAAALALMIYLACIESGTSLVEGCEAFTGMSLYLWLAFAGMISTIAMLLPGISGSFVLLLMGGYTLALEAIADFNIPVLLSLSAGCLVGAFIGIKLIKKMLRFHPQALYLSILGLIIGSLFTVYPGFVAGIQGVVAIILMVLFAVVAYMFSLKSN